MTAIHVATAHRELPDGELRLLGAVDQVTGAMTRVEIGGAKLLVDCGVAQGDEAERWSVPDAAHEVDAVLLTHAHNDHVGSVPALIERGFDGPILGTRATLDIARIVLDDALHLQHVPAGEARRILARFDQLRRVVPYDELGRHVPGTDVRIAFREAGHILGSASVEIRSPKSRVIVSGDLGRPNAPILRDYHTAWEKGPPVDAVVMESTYGEREHASSHDDIRGELERIVKRAMKNRGHILVPAFAIGRTQTLLWYLNDLVESGRIEGLPVAVDTRMGLAVTETYQERKSLYDAEASARLRRGDDPFDFEDLYAVRKGGQSVRLREMPGPMLVIAGSGMCTGGRIVGHLRELLPEPSTTVLFVGYQGAGTLGRRIQQAAKGRGRVRVDGEEVQVNAEIETLSGLSAHADRRELARWLDAIPEVRDTHLHHGELSAQRAFAEWYPGRA
jgi:metallo-beta-lactamase family protein